MFLLPNRSSLWDFLFSEWVLEDCAALFYADQFAQPVSQVQDENKNTQIH